MSRRCKPGIRARILCGNNIGKIVFVVRRYFGEAINDATWPRALFPWVVTSLGSPLRSTFINTGKEAPPSMTIVVDDCDLEPIDDDEDDQHERESDPLKIPQSPVATDPKCAA